MHVRFSYLKEKFKKYEAQKIFDKMWKEVIEPGDYTLGKSVKDFEEKFAHFMGVKHAIGVANGTDAIELSLKVLGVKPGDEVICPANTFVASLGAVGNIGATPVLVDIGDDYVMNPDLIRQKVTYRTKAILPVHFCGNPVAMDKVLEVAAEFRLKVVEDACQSYLASYKGKYVGSIGDCGAFSLHPLKILNVMGDGGMITTNNTHLYNELRLLQNHGLKDRDTITRFPCRNSRLDSLQACVGLYQIDQTPGNVLIRQSNAEYYDERLKEFVHICPRDPDKASVYHLYFIEVDAGIRDDLYKFLINSSIEAKIHYKVPLYLQEGLAILGHKKGDFPNADRICDRIITLPVDELVTREMMDYVISKVKEFMFVARTKDAPKE